jgi:lysophospholipase L1-like esterase
MPAETLNRKTKFVLYLVMAAIPLLFTEALVRVYFSTQVGPSVLLYGTPWSRHQERFDPVGAASKRMEDEGTSVAFHRNVTASYSKYYPNELLFDRDEFGEHFNVAINSHGFRGRDFQPSKRPGVVRIITLGASSTFGFLSPDHQTYPVILQENLNSVLPRRFVNAPSAPVTEFEVINLGIPHLTSDQIYSLFVKEGLALKPDFVTFYEGINDAVAPPDTSGERAKQAIKAVPFANRVFAALRARLLTVAFIGSVTSYYVLDTVISREDFHALREGKRERFIGNLQRLADVCRENGIRFIVASQSATSREQHREQLKTLTYSAEQTALGEKLAAGGGLVALEAYILIHGELMDAEREWAIANKVPRADVIAAMDGNRQNLITWVHLNAAGNQLVASVLSKTILNELGSNAE